MSSIEVWMWTRDWWNLVRIGFCQGVISTAFVALLLWSLRHRTTCRLRYLLWCLLFIKVAAPPLPGWGIFPSLWPKSGRLSIGPAADAVPALVDDLPSPRVSSAQQPLDADVVTPSMPVSRRWDWKAVGMGIHVLGAAAFLAALIGFQSSLWFRLRRKATRLTDGVWFEDLQRLRQRLGIRGRVELWMLPGLDFPVAFGILKQRILLPEWAVQANGERRAAILGHELTHIRRRDTWAVWMENLLFAFQWWNPIVHVVRLRLHRERERLCDALVLQERICNPLAYAHTLVDALAQSGCRHRLRWGTEMVSHGQSISKRLEAIMSGSTKRESRLGFFGLAAVVLVAALVLPGLPMPRWSPVGESFAQEQRNDQPQKDTAEPKEKPAPKKSDATLALERALQRPASVDFEYTPLMDVIEFIRDFGNINVVIDQNGLDVARVPKDTPITIKFNDVPIGSALKLILLEHDLGFIIDDETILITDVPRDKKRERLQEQKTIEATKSASRQAVEKALKQSVSLDLTDVPLADVVELLRSQTKANIIIDRKGLAVKMHSPDTNVTLKTETKSLEAALKQLLTPIGLVAVVQYDVLLITNLPEGSN